MASILVTQDGRFILAGGKFINATAGSTGSSGSLTSLTLQPFPVSHTLAKPVFQRRAGTDYGNVWIPFGYAGGTPSSVQARVVNAITSAVIKDWATLTSISTDSSGNGLGCLSVVPIGWPYVVQIRDGNQIGNGPTSPATGMQRWGVGVRIMYTGQSNMATTTLVAGSYTDIVPNYGGKTELDYWADSDKGSSYYTTDGFNAPEAIGGSGSNAGAGSIDLASGGVLATCRIASMALSAKYGRTIPVCSILWAVSSNGLNTFLLGGSQQAIFANSGHTLGSFGMPSAEQYGGGDFEIVMQHVGEANSDGTVPRATYKGWISQFYQQCLNIVAPFGRDATTLTYMPAILGVYNVGASAMTYVEDIRGAVIESESDVATTWPNLHVGWTTIDMIPTTGNPLHFTNKPDELRSHRRMMQSVINKVAPALAPYSGRGPKLSGAVTRSGLVATFTVQHEGGTALQPKAGSGAITGWYANTALDFSGTDIAVTAAISGANTINVTFPSGTTFPVYVKHAGGHIGTLASQFPDMSNPVCDNVVYPFCKTSSTDATNIFAAEAITDGLPLWPTPNAIMVN